MAYFPVILIVGQILANCLWFLDRGIYYEYGFYLGLVFGTNLFFALFLVSFTHLLRFCYVSRACAWAQLAYAVNYLVVQQDNIYNIWFQIGVGVLALIWTFWNYIKKFPLCRLSLFIGFIVNVIKQGSCKKGLENWERDITSIIIKQNRQKNVG